MGLAESFCDRLLGIKSPSAAAGLVIEARSIHTMGLRRTLTVFAVDQEGVVLDVRLVPPNRIAFFPAAHLIIELPSGQVPAHAGSRVEVKNG